MKFIRNPDTISYKQTKKTKNSIYDPAYYNISIHILDLI